MTRIGLVSDSAGDAPLLARALAALEQAGAERFFFMGGRWADADAALALPPLAPGAAARVRARLARVASRACPERAGGAAPAKALEMVAGALGYLVHDKADLTRDEIASATFLFHGAVDAPALVRIGPRFFVSPGRLSAPGGGSWGLLAVDEGRVELTVYGADGRERARLAEQAPGGAQVKLR